MIILLRNEEKYSRFSFGGFTGLLTLYFQTYFMKAPLLFLFSALSELGMIVILTIVGGGTSYVPIAIAGSLVSGTFLIGSGQMPVELRNLNQSKFRNMIVSSPVNPIAFIFAVSIGSGVHLIIQLIILIAILIILTHISLIALIQIIFSLVLLWVFGISFGYFLSIRNVSNVKLRQITQILRIFFVLFAPIYYPATFLHPLILQQIALVLPTTNTAIILRNLTGNADVVKGTTLVLNWSILLIWTIILFLIAIKSRRWEDI